MPLCLTLNIIRYGSRVSRVIQGNEYRASLHLSLVAIEKEAIGSPSTTVANFYNFVLITLIKNGYLKLYLLFTWSYNFVIR